MLFCLVNSLANDAASVKRRKTLPSGRPFPLHSQHSWTPSCTCEQVRWALTKVQRPTDPRASLTARAHRIVIVLGVLSPTDLSNQCVSHARPGWMSQTLFLFFHYFFPHFSSWFQWAKLVLVSKFFSGHLRIASVPVCILPSLLT